MKKLAYAGALLAILVGVLLAPQRASAQLLPPLPGGSLIVTVTSPSSGATVSGTIPVNASVGIVGTLTVSRVEFFRDGNFIGSDSSAPYSVSWNTTTVGNGSHTLVAVGVDILGVRWNSSPVTVTVSNDTTPPTVSIASPANGATVSGTITVSANASDNVGVAGVRILLDGVNLGAEDTASPYSVSWNTTGAANGSHTLTAVARDAAGNTRTSAAVTVTVSNDTIRPTVTINQAASQADPSSASPINFTVVFSEQVSGFTASDVSISGTAGGTKTATVSGGPNAYNVAVSGMTSSGTVIATIAAGVAQDAAGNTNTASTSTDNTVQFNLPDTTAPTVSITSPASGATVSGTAVTVTASAADETGVAGVRFFVGAMEIGVEDSAAPYQASWNTTTVADGSYTLTAVARDAAGNTRTSDAVTVTVSNGPPPDTAPPSASITSPANGATVSGTITVAASASDNVGVVSVQFFLDGALITTDTSAPYSLSWNTTGAANGPHTLTAVARDAAGNTTTSAGVTVTVANDSAAVTRFEESSPAVIFDSNWVQRREEVAAFSGDPAAASSSDVAGAAARFTFTGKAVSWIGLKCSVCGIATVSIDGGPPVPVDTAGPAAPGPGLKSETLFATSGLAAGTHTLVITVTGASASGGNHIIVDAFDVAGPSASVIAVENMFPGSENWQMRRTGPGGVQFQPADDVGKQIKGYASATSVNKGESITFHVSTLAQQYTMDVYRMGWYQGRGGRLLQHVESLPGVLQPACPTDAATGLTECAWTPSHTLEVPLTWTSGVYVVHLTSAPYQTYITFVVRDDARPADILYQQSVTTYQAYNNYPDDGATGKSLYDFNSRGAPTVTGSPRAAKVSWDRPYTGEGAGQFFDWEYYFVRWLERSGYDVAYSTNLDTHRNSARLLDYKAFLSVGHDEYWSKAMYDGVEAARDAGVSLGFFGADAVFWQVRLEPSPLSGAADRVMVGYKNRSVDPVANDQDPANDQLTTVLWRDPFLNRPEQRLIGVQFSGQLATNAPYVVANSSSWVYEGTGLVDGDSIPGIVGYEADTSMPDVPLPTSVPGTYQVLSQSPYTDVAGPQLIGNSSIYQAPSGAWVFGAGTISWSWGLDRAGVVDPRIQRTTANLLNRFLGISSQP